MLETIMIMMTVIEAVVTENVDIAIPPQKNLLRIGNDIMTTVVVIETDIHKVNLQRTTVLGVEEGDQAGPLEGTQIVSHHYRSKDRQRDNDRNDRRRRDVKQDQKYKRDDRRSPKRQNQQRTPPRQSR